MTKTAISPWGLGFKLRRVTAISWLLSRCYYRCRGARLLGRPQDEIWYFAYGANMHDFAFRVRRGIQPLEHRSARIKGYRVRFNLEGRPKGKAAPANLYPDPDTEVWGVLYRITRRDLMRLDSTEGVPGRGYRHVEIEAEDRYGRMIRAVTYLAQGAEVDGKPSLRYITLLRDGAMARGRTGCPKITFGFWKASSMRCRDSRGLRPPNGKPHFRCSPGSGPHRLSGGQQRPSV